MLTGILQKSLNELITGRKIGITYDVDNEQYGKARGGTFAEDLLIRSCNSNRQGQLSTISIERGAKFSDNWKVQPRTLNIVICVNDNDSITDNSIITTAKNLITGTSKLNECARLLDYLYTNAVLCDIKTTLHDYNGFKLINDPFVEDCKTREFITYNTVWQEVPFYSEEMEEDRKRINGEIASLGDKIKKFTF